MSLARRYCLSQFLAIPFVALPTLVGGFVLGGPLIRHLKVETGIYSHGLTFACMLGLGLLTARGTGMLLCACGLLPQGAQRTYPHARSWQE
jgi:hypothetical protein